jgi:hypothetical protein
MTFSEFVYVVLLTITTVGAIGTVRDIIRERRTKRSSDNTSTDS